MHIHNKLLNNSIETIREKGKHECTIRGQMGWCEYDCNTAGIECVTVEQDTKK